MGEVVAPSSSPAAAASNSLSPILSSPFSPALPHSVRSFFALLANGHTMQSNENGFDADGGWAGRTDKIQGKLSLSFSRPESALDDRAEIMTMTSL